MTVADIRATIHHVDHLQTAPVLKPAISSHHPAEIRRGHWKRGWNAQTVGRSIHESIFVVLDNLPIWPDGG